MKRILSISLLLACPFLLTSCGGGGGGGGGGSGVRLLHAAIDATPVSFTTSADPMNPLATVAFGDTPQYASVSDGKQILNATLLGNNSAAVGVSVDYVSGDKKSVLLFEPRGAQDYHIALLDDGAGDIAAGLAAVRVVDGVGQAAQLDLTLNGSPVSGGVAQGAATPYANVAAGTVTLTAAAFGHRIFSGSFTVAAGTAYTIMLIGENGYLVVGRLLSD